MNLTASTVVPVPKGLAYWWGALSVVLMGGCGAAVIASYNALLQRIEAEGLIEVKFRKIRILDIERLRGPRRKSGL